MSTLLLESVFHHFTFLWQIVSLDAHHGIATHRLTSTVFMIRHDVRDSLRIQMSSNRFLDVVGPAEDDDRVTLTWWCDMCRMHSWRG